MQPTPTNKKIITLRRTNLQNLNFSTCQTRRCVKHDKCQTSIFLRGLKFIPTPKSNSVQLKCELKTFAHKPRLTEDFDNHNVAPVDQKISLL